MTSQGKTIKKEGSPRQFEGIVVSNKMKDTIVVRIDRYVKHPRYEKYVTKTKRLKVHDKGNTKNVGDKVLIRECAPISKDKSFTLAS